MFVLYYALIFRCWQLIWILLKTNHPYLKVVRHIKSAYLMQFDEVFSQGSRLMYGMSRHPPDVSSSSGSCYKIMSRQRTDWCRGNGQTNTSVHSASATWRQSLICLLNVWQLWLEISNWASLPCFHPQSWQPEEAVPDWFSKLAGRTTASSCDRTTANGVRTLVILVCWSIWRERNERVFDGRQKSVARLVLEIKEEVGAWAAAGAKHLAQRVVPRISE
jgi:hypothetical protein